MDYRQIVRDRAQAHGVDPNIAEAVMIAESGGKPNAMSPAGAYGPMQLMEPTARGLGVDRKDPLQNIEGGVLYLKENLNRFGGDVASAVAAYNAGPGRVSKTADFAQLPKETQAYVPKVMNMAATLADARQPVGQPTSDVPQSESVDLGLLHNMLSKASAAKDTAAVTEISNVLSQQYGGMLKKAQAANDTEAVAEIKAAMQQFAPKPAAAAPVSTASTAAKAAPPASKKEDNRSILRRVDDFVRGAADTLTFGYADEIAAKLDALVGGGQSGLKSYEVALAAQRQRDKEGGGERLAGQLVGGLAPTIGVVRAVDGATRLARAGAGAATGAIQGGLYGTGSAEGSIEDRLKQGAIGAGIGAATGGVLGAVIPATITQKGNAIIKNAGSEDAARFDAEIRTELKKLADNETKRGNPLSTIDANALETKYINDVNVALKKLGKTEDVAPIREAIMNRRALTTEDLGALRTSVAGNAAADAIEKAQRLRSLTQAAQSSGGLMPLIREGIDQLPLPQWLNRGLKAAAGGRQTRERAIQRAVNEAAAAENVLQRLGPSRATASMDTLNAAVDKAQKSQAAKKAADEAARAAKARAEAEIKIQVLQDTRMPQTGAFANLLSGGKSNLNLKSDQAIEGLRLLSRQFKDRPVGEAAKTILKSNNVDESTSAFYGVQNALRKLEERGVIQGQPGALSAFMDQGGKRVFNPEAYRAAIKTADEARQFAVQNAPNKALGQFANTVAKTVKPEDKLKLIEDRLAKTSDPVVRDYLENLVRPLAEYGAKAKK